MPAANPAHAGTGETRAGTTSIERKKLIVIVSSSLCLAVATLAWGGPERVRPNSEGSRRKTERPIPPRPRFVQPRLIMPQWRLNQLMHQQSQILNPQPAPQHHLALPSVRPLTNRFSLYLHDDNSTTNDSTLVEVLRPLNQ